MPSSSPNHMYPPWRQISTRRRQDCLLSGDQGLSWTPWRSLWWRFKMTKSRHKPSYCYLISIKLVSRALYGHVCTSSCVKLCQILWAYILTQLTDCAASRSNHGRSPAWSRVEFIAANALENYKLLLYRKKIHLPRHSMYSYMFSSGFLW